MQKNITVAMSFVFALSFLGIPSESHSNQQLNGVEKMTQKSQSEVAPLTEYPSAIGYYLRTGKHQFYHIGEYILRGELGLNKLGQVTHVPLDNDIDSFELIINAANVVDLQRLAPRFYAQSAAIVNPDFVKVLDVQAEQVAENIFRVKAGNLEKGDIITIVDTNAVYAVSLGEISQNLVDTFSTIDWPASEIVYSLEQALKSFPDNQDLKNLLAQKRVNQGNEKLAKISKDIDQKVNNFNSAEKHASKRVHADDVIHEIEYYEAVAEEAGESLPEHIVQLKKEMKTFLETPERQVLPELDKSKIASEVTYFQVSRFNGTSAGSGNLIVSVLAVGEQDMLIRFRGIANEFDGKVLRARKEITNDSTKTYIAKTTEVTGNNWNLFMYENDGWSSGSFSAYPPAIQTKVDLYRSSGDDISTIDSPEAMFSDYMKSVDSKTSSEVKNKPEVSAMQW